jgi:hypothetical protein
MIVDAMAKSIDLGEIVWKREGWIFAVKVGDDFVNCGGNLEKKGVVDELDVTVEWELDEVSLSKLYRKTEKLEETYRILHNLV